MNKEKAEGILDNIRRFELAQRQNETPTETGPKRISLSTGDPEENIIHVLLNAWPNLKRLEKALICQTLSFDQSVQACSSLTRMLVNDAIQSYLQLQTLNQGPLGKTLSSEIVLKLNLTPRTIQALAEILRPQMEAHSRQQPTAPTEEQ